jgi:hypothetical protein
MKGKPHVSEALAHLRHGVTLCALLVCLAAVAQFMVFGFVHFTTVRWREVVPTVEEQPLSIVARDTPEPAIRREPREVASLNPAAPKGEPALKVEPAPRVEPAPTAAQTEPARAEHEPSLELTAADPILRRVSELAATIGSAATVALCLLVMLGVAVAAGGAIPGVQKAVSAASWAILLAMVCLPWRDFAPRVPFQGVFGPYSELVAASAAVDHGGSLARLMGNFLLLPMAAMFVSLLILARFRAGVADGVIVTSVSELDEVLDREMAHISRRGVGLSGTRAVGALNQALGAATTIIPPPPPEPEPQPEPDPELIRRTAPEPPSPRPHQTPRGRFVPADSAEPFRRPI